MSTSSATTSRTDTIAAGGCGPRWPPSGSVSRGSAFVAVSRPNRKNKRPIRSVPKERISRPPRS